MPRKSKEELLEKDIIDTKKAKNTKPSTVKVKASKKSSNSSSKTNKAKVSTVSESSKSTVKKAASNTKTSKMSATKKASTSKKSSTSSKKNTTVKKESAKKKSSATSKKTSVVRKNKSTTNKKQILKHKISNKITKLSSKTFTKVKKLPFIVEYYDLPYKYNKTVIKALAQNPNTLFVYWEISDKDVNNIKEKYGENIFYTTKPVLIIHNLTDKYSFEIDINDFANNWYIHVNDTKCQYVIELGRRPKDREFNNLPDNYLYVTSSNMIESPNDHVLFYDSEQYREIRFKNIHTGKYTTRIIKPFLKNLYELYKSLHLDKENISFDFKNPSSQNPTSNVF